jgi:hypothetical protein
VGDAQGGLKCEEKSGLHNDGGCSTRVRVSKKSVVEGAVMERSWRNDGDGLIVLREVGKPRKSASGC